MDAADNGTLTLDGIAAAVASGVDVNGKRCGDTALHCAVVRKRRELVAALLAAGADANVKSDYHDRTSVWRGAVNSTADILQLLIDGGGSVNEADSHVESPLIALVRNNNGDAAARLGVLLAQPELDLDAKYQGRTAEERAVEWRRPELAAAIAAEVSSLALYFFPVVRPCALLLLGVASCWRCPFSA